MLPVGLWRVRFLRQRTLRWVEGRQFAGAHSQISSCGEGKEADLGVGWSLPGCGLRKGLSWPREL